MGGHEDLLPYLVRRLLENGANTSFVHALLDDRVPVEKVVVDPIDAVEAQPGPHAKIPTPRLMYGDRLNSMGVDLSVADERDSRLVELQVRAQADKPLIPAGKNGNERRGAVRSPDRRRGHRPGCRSLGRRDRRRLRLGA